MTERERRARFDELAERWRRETWMHSNPHFIVNNGAFREMADMGEEALPLILQKIEAGESGQWWMLLERITGVRLTAGVTPIPEVPGWVRTDVATLKAAWISWGRERGYLTDTEGEERWEPGRPTS